VPLKGPSLVSPPHSMNASAPPRFKLISVLAFKWLPHGKAILSFVFRKHCNSHQWGMLIHHPHKSAFMLRPTIKTQDLPHEHGLKVFLFPRVTQYMYIFTPTLPVYVSAPTTCSAIASSCASAANVRHRCHLSIPRCQLQNFTLLAEIV
jgi:hypothetical protein